MINEFRKKKLKLRPVTYLSGSQGSGNDIPHGYIWSPHLVPKPKGLLYLLARAESWQFTLSFFSHISSKACGSESRSLISFHSFFSGKSY
jgi:hypothetical protein